MYNVANMILLIIIAYQLRSIYLSYRAPNIIPEEIQSVKQQTKGKMQIIDTRSIGRFNKGSIKGSKHISYGNLFSEMEKLPKNKKIILVSERGTQTGRAVTKMLKEGYDVVNLKGGYKAWAKYQKD